MATIDIKIINPPPYNDADKTEIIIKNVGLRTSYNLNVVLTPSCEEEI